MSGCTASTCTKYVPGEHRGRLKKEVTLDDEDIKPRRVKAHQDVTHKVPPEIIQLPRVDPAAVPAFDNAGAASHNAKLHGTSPRPPRGADPSPSLPASYESRDWRSVTKAEFPRRHPDAPSRDLRVERANNMRLSSVTLAATGMGLGAMGVHSKDALPRYDAEWYARRGQRSNAIGGPHEKSTSSVVVAGAEGDPAAEQQYESMMRRQFTVHGAGNSAAKCKENQEDMQRSHWSIALSDARPPRVSVMKEQLLASPAPIKGRPPQRTAAAAAFRCTDAKDSRPDPRLQEAARAALLRSSVPLMGAPRNIGGPTDVPERAMDTAAFATRDMTSTASTYPRYVARPAKTAANPAEDGSSGLTMGTDRSRWVTSQRSHFRGVWIG